MRDVRGSNPLFSNIDTALAAQHFFAEISFHTALLAPGANMHCTGMCRKAGPVPVLHLLLTWCCSYGAPHLLQSLRLIKILKVNNMEWDESNATPTPHTFGGFAFGVGGGGDGGGGGGVGCVHFTCCFVLRLCSPSVPRSFSPPHTLPTPPQTHPS